MRSKWITMLAGVIAAVVLVSVAIGLTSPDGTVGDEKATSAAKATTATPTQTPTSTRPSAARAPASVAGTWPGRPDQVADNGGSAVNWCPAVRTKGAGEAEKVFGKPAVDKAACAAVQFTFGKRYSRLAIPRDSYAAKDLSFVLPTLASTTVSAYRPRINAFVANPNSTDVREELGLVVLRGEGTPASAQHTSAGRGRVFYGKAFSTDGYRDRAVWINPTWSKVAISVDRSKARPRIVATLDASAAIPVFNTARRRDDMLTIPTHATFYLRRDNGSAWKIGGWRITSGTYDYAKLKLR